MAGTTPKISRDVLEAKRLLARSLAAEPGVVGVGVEAGAGDRAVLVVLLEEGSPGGRRGVPGTFQGVPVRVRRSSRAKKR